MNNLHNYGIYSLKDASIGDSEYIGKIIRKLTTILELARDKVDLWEGYLNL
jgi:hypothetical protein